MAPDRRREILERFEFFRYADEYFRRDFVSGASIVRLSPGHLVFREGQPCDKIVFLGRGSVRVYKRSEAGRELMLYRVGAGEPCILNIACIAAGLEFPAFAVAEDTVEAVAAPPKRFLDWMDRCAPVRGFVLQTMSRRIVSLLLRVEDLTLTPIERRLAGLLVVGVEAQGPGIDVTHEALAAELGSAREVVSRALKKLEHRAIVRLHRGHIEVLNREALELLGRPGSADAGLT